MMDALRGLLLRLRAIVRRDVADRELRDELRFHTEMAQAELVRRGIAPDVARRMALVSFGGSDRFAESARDERGARWFDDARHDVRLTLRMVRRSPHFSLAVVLTLALGIGANTAIFSVVDAVLLRAVPFPDADRLVMIWQTDRASATAHEPASWPDIVDLRARSRALTQIGAVMAQRGTLNTGGEAEHVSVLAVTPNVPDLLGVTPLVGRTFDARAGLGILSERFWRERFGSARDVIGTTIDVNGQVIEIVGVMPRDADLGMAQMHARADYSSPLTGPIDVWVSSEPTAAEYPRETHPFLTVGRMSAAATLARTQRELAAIMAELEAAFPENAERGVNVEPYSDVTFGPVRRALVVLLGGVMLVLLIACVNVANLLLARAAGRRREVAVRRAMGASPSRIRRQFLMESVLLTLLGAAAGVLFAHAGVRALVALAPPDIPRLDNAVIDLRVLAIATTASMAVCIIFGLAPLLDSRRLDLQGVLKSQSGRSGTDSRESRRFRDSLVVAEFALAVALVVAAGLLVRSFHTLTSVDPGFRTSGVLAAGYQLEPPSRYPMDFARWPDLPEINTFHATFLEQLRALPGVEQAALAARSPLDAGITNSFVIVGREAESADFPEIRTRFITPGYLATLDVPLLAGRDLERGDGASAEGVALINAAAAARYFTGEDPLERRLRFWGRPWRIVGIMGDERFNGVDAPAEPAVYVPLAQAPQTAVTLLARTSGDPSALTASIRDALRRMDVALVLSDAQPLDRALASSMARPRFVTMLLGLFAGLALLLALIGVHGVLSYSVAQRTSEIGIRLALGATRAGVLRLVMGEGLMLAGIGTIVGLAAAALAARSMASLLFGVSAHDVVTFALGAAAVISLAAVASLLPARRASRAQPAAALRSE